MAFDFTKLSSGSAIAGITEPATLFDALPNKAEGYGYLRAVQKTVLDAWYLRRDDRDVVIKTNTGGGKTIVGLLMLQSSLNEKKGPAVYLAPEPHLAQRVRSEAANLGLTVADDPESPRFLIRRAGDLRHDPPDARQRQVALRVVDRGWPPAGTRWFRRCRRRARRVAADGGGHWAADPTFARGAREARRVVCGRPAGAGTECIHGYQGWR